MKTAGVLTIATLAALAATANAHGKMTKPAPREVTDWYLENAGALANAGTEELTIAPIENLSGRSQSDFPEGANFNLENGCRGFIYEDGNTVTTIAPGATFDLEWWIQAPHPGYMNLSIVKPSTDSAGTITYEKYLTILNIDPFANTGGTDSTTATMPDTVEGCEAAGDCALQFWWHSDIASQTYPSCADIIVSGSGAATTPTATTAAPAADDESDAGSSATTPTATTAAPATTTAAPATTTAAPAADSSASIGGDADDEYDTPATTTAAPTADKCNARRSRRD